MGNKNDLKGKGEGRGDNARRYGSVGNDENEIVRGCRKDIQMEGYERNTNVKNKNIILRNE